MTANELADSLDKIWDNECRSPIVSKSADMIRQQQAEIKALKDKIISYENLGSTMINELLQKASEKRACNKCNDTGWVCECHPNKEAHKCCGGAGMPCKCTKGDK